MLKEEYKIPAQFSFFRHYKGGDNNTVYYPGDTYWFLLYNVGKKGNEVSDMDLEKAVFEFIKRRGPSNAIGDAVTFNNIFEKVFNNDATHMKKRRKWLKCQSV